MRKKLFFFIFTIFFLKLYCEESPIEKAKSEFKKKNYDNVIKILEKEKKKDNPEINFYLAISYYNLKNFEKSKKELEFLILNKELGDPYIVNESLKCLFDIYWRDKKIEDVIKIGEHIFKKIEKNPKFSATLSLLKNNISRAYGDKGDTFFWTRDYKNAIENYLISISYNPQNFVIKERLGESYYNIGEIEKSKEEFLEVIKNEKNNWYILVLSTFFYMQIEEEKRKREILTFLSSDELSYKIFKSFEEFYLGNIGDGFEILKYEEEKRKTNGDITFNIINRIFTYDFSSLDIYLSFMKNYPASIRNEGIIKNLYRTISDEENRKIFEKKVEELMEILIKDEKNKEIGIKLYMDITEGKFEGKLMTIDDYIEKINQYEKIIEKYGENKYKEEIMRRIADLYIKIEKYDMAEKIYKKMIDDFKKENYYLQIGEIYFKEKNLVEAKNMIENYLIKNKDNESAKLLLAKIYIEEGKVENGFEILNRIEKETKNRSIQKEIENIKKDIVEIKEVPNNSLFLIMRKIDFNSTRLIPEDKVLFLNQFSDEIEFYTYSEDKKINNFILKKMVDNMNFTSEPYVMVDYENDKLYLTWKGETPIDKSRFKKKNVFKVLYPVKEIMPDCFDLIFKNELNEGKYVLYLDFIFLEDNWEVNIKNYKNYEKTIKIEPNPIKEEGNVISWIVKDRNFNIKIEYLENKNIIYYFPEIEIKKIKKEEKIFENKDNKVIFDNFELKIENFVPEKIKILNEEIKVYNFKERLYRIP